MDKEAEVLVLTCDFDGVEPYYGVSHWKRLSRAEESRLGKRTNVPVLSLEIRIPQGETRGTMGKATGTLRLRVILPEVPKRNGS